jgi:hypothetical protein
LRNSSPKVSKIVLHFYILYPEQGYRRVVCKKILKKPRKYLYAKNPAVSAKIHTRSGRAAETTGEVGGVGHP